jgi:glucose-6-phosphate isomerase, archaeal
MIQDFSTGILSGEGITEIRRSLRDLAGVFRDSVAQTTMDPNTLVYSVQLYQPVQEGLEGGLFWGSTVIEPGMVGDEYFLTKGHFHSVRNRAEYYVTVRGTGALILMTEDRKTRMELMRAGSTHYIPGVTAHRVANVGNTQLCFIACWPSDAGHDYETIQEHGFGARLRRVDGEPRLVAA